MDPRGHSSRLDAWNNCLRAILIGLSDQSLITGLAITIAALSFGLHDMDIYHFELAMSLASLALGAHLLSIMILLVGYQPKAGDCVVSSPGQKPHRRQGWHAWIVLFFWKKACIMITMALILFMYARSLSELPPNCPMSCAGSTSVFTPWQRLRAYLVAFIIADTCSFVGGGIVIQVQLVRENRSWHEESRNWHPLLRFLYRTWLTSSSVLAFGSIFCAATLLLHDYMRSRSYFSERELQLENNMGFGQIIPLLLLMLPFMAAATAYSGESL